ncbi:uncharacterized protein A4U43_C04F2860 [Asparagus officinalis]|uniref:Uncharacterized protein n=1 Tax=Asparagus officinalis TaxID=4686 RepID=A0A5P1EXR9_ASPOF|nr:uncharacterized protein LOC109838124 [Asparagus officinalis]ONK70918.1 uncharacterized protein A4U43_C04F2860 [Asparagus officinalis]
MSRTWMRNGRSIGRGYSPVPSWERTFCSSVCGVPWRKICEAKDYTLRHENIADWDDSGALKAFENAKARYWSKINGLACDVPTPDPDLFFDEVDHHDATDPELIADLENEDTASRGEGDDQEEDLSFEAAYEALRRLPVVATGWGDAEEGDEPLRAAGRAADAKDRAPADGKYDGNPRDGKGWGRACRTHRGWRGRRRDDRWRKQKKFAPNEQENRKTTRKLRPKTSQSEKCFV